MSEEVVIEVTGLTKTFRNRLRKAEVCAVHQVNLQVRRGSVVAFIGPNGAGKTTTIYTLLGLLQPDQGSVRIFGQPAGSRPARRRTGFQSEIFHTYGFKTAEAVLRFYGELRICRRRPLPRRFPASWIDSASRRRVRGKWVDFRRAWFSASAWPRRCCTAQSC